MKVRAQGWFLLILSCVGILSTPLSAATVTYQYDSLGRLTNATHSDGANESYLCDQAGNRLSRITHTATSIVDTTSPSAPTNLAFLTFTPSQLRIGWSRSYDTGGSGLDGYVVYVNGSIVTNTTSTNFFLSGLRPNTTYCLTVAAYDRNANVSAQSSPLCLTNVTFQPPFLSVLAYATGQFEFGIASGTPGPYEIIASTNLIDWEFLTNVFLPTPGDSFIDLGAAQFPRRFYQLRWSTNAPNR